ncbi:MAG: hypothetical protein OXL96_05695 [Candidatus Poribacteria bacterium]|nr:hypothetical protein [Candidatus Poribacteria bacterium]
MDTPQASLGRPPTPLRPALARYRSGEAQPTWVKKKGKENAKAKNRYRYPRTAQRYREIQTRKWYQLMIEYQQRKPRNPRR